MKDTIFSNFLKVDNIGDLHSSPLDHFDFKNSEKINFLDLHLSKNNEIVLPNLVFGGGGMLHDVFVDIFERFTKHPQRRKLIFWGAGINEHDLDKQYFPTFLNNFDLVGLRDYNNPWNHVPCPSCMSPVFDSIKHPITDFVIYNHSNHDICIETFVKKNNALIQGESLLDIINFLSQGETIITNSYHGAYWGLLMNRKVLIYKPFSNRFYGFKYQPPFCDEKKWDAPIERASPPDYLMECRSLNQEFKKKVEKVLNLSP